MWNSSFFNWKCLFVPHFTSKFIILIDLFHTTCSQPKDRYSCMSYGLLFLTHLHDMLIIIPEYTVICRMLFSNQLYASQQKFQLFYIAFRKCWMPKWFYLCTLKLTHIWCLAFVTSIIVTTVNELAEIMFCSKHVGWDHNLFESCFWSIVTEQSS
jgi:hypothetical protein